MYISVQDYARECAEQGLRGDYSVCRTDFTVDQAYDYSDEDQEVWRTLCDRQTRLTRELAHRSYLDGVETLGLLERMPHFHSTGGTISRTSLTTSNKKPLTACAGGVLNNTEMNSVQLRLHFADGVGEKFGLCGSRCLFRQQLLGGGDGDVDGGGTDGADGVFFGLLDLLFRKGRTAGDEFFRLLPGFFRQRCCFAFSGSNDTCGFGFCFLALALIFGQQVLSLFTQALGFGQLVLDVLGALIQRLGEHARNLEIGDQNEEKDEADESEK